MLSTTSNITKDIIIESNSRSVKVYKLHNKYRRDYMKEIYDDFIQTDYLVTMADESSAQLEITHGSPTRRSGDGKCRGSPSFKKIKTKTHDELTSEELQTIRTKDPRQPFVHYRSPSSRRIAPFLGSAGRVTSNSEKEFVRRYEFWRTRKLNYGSVTHKQSESSNFSSRKASPSNTYSDYFTSSGRIKLPTSKVLLEEEEMPEEMEADAVRKKIQFSDDEEAIKNDAVNVGIDVNDEDIQLLGENGPILGANLHFDLSEESLDENSENNEGDNEINKATQNDHNEENEEENINENAQNAENIPNEEEENANENDQDIENTPGKEEESTNENAEIISNENDALNQLGNKDDQTKEEEEAVADLDQQNNNLPDGFEEEEEEDLNVVERNAALPENQIIEEEEEIEEDFEPDHDINNDLEFPPGFGPNTLGINAYALQRNALSDSSDDGDGRPSNCGCSPGGDGYAELVLQLSPDDFVPAMNTLFKDEFTLLTVPKVEFDTLRSKGFNWILVDKINDSKYGLGQNADEYSKLARILHTSRLLFAAEYVNDECTAHLDGVFVNNESDLHHLKQLYPLKTYITTFQNEQSTYFFDERPILSLRERNDLEIQSAIYNVNEKLRRHFVHILDAKDLNFNDRSVRTAAAMLLTLPGMRIINFRELGLADLILIVLSKKAVRRGVFSLVNATSNTGSLVAWKYTKGNQHILIAANFDTRQTTGHIICDDAPNPSTNSDENNKIEVVDILTQTTYMRDPQELRKDGLTVILYEYEIQIFEY